MYVQYMYMYTCAYIYMRGLILSLFWKGFTEKGAIASMIVGFLGVLFFKFVMPTIGWVGIYFDKIAELAPALLLGILTGYLVSKMYLFVSCYGPW